MQKHSNRKNQRKVLDRPEMDVLIAMDLIKNIINLENDIYNIHLIWLYPFKLTHYIVFVLKKQNKF